MTRARKRLDIVGHGSLLLVAANIVGALVVALLLMAARVKSAAPPDAEASPVADLDERRKEAGSLEDEILGMNAEAQKLAALAAARYAERGTLATAVAAGEKMLADRRAALDGEARRQYDLANEIAQAKAELARLEAARGADANKPAKTIQIQNYPNPISHVVNGRELHFQLKDGRITVIPWDELMNKLKGLFAEKIWRLKDQDEFTDTLGPAGGFTLRYTMAKEEMSFEAAQYAGHGGTIIQLALAEFLPVKNDIGETAEEAMAPGSAFHAVIADLRPGDWTCTLWVYPDSFEVFRAVRRDLYQLGFPIAARPMLPEMIIGASPNGSKSSAE